MYSKLKSDVSGMLNYPQGADNVIYERLAGTNQDIKRLTREHLEQFGSSGLRTLCLAYRDLAIDTYENWNEKFVQAKSSLRDREKKLDEVCSDIVLFACYIILSCIFLSVLLLTFV